MNVLMLAYFSCKASVWYAFVRIGSKGNTTPAFLTQVGFIVCMLGGPQECHCRGWDFVMKEWCFLIELTNWTSPSPKIQGSFHVHLGIPEIFEISNLVLMAVVDCNVELSAVSSSVVPPPIR